MTDQPKEPAKEPAEKSEKIDFTKIPDGTVTVIVKNKGKVHTTGLTLPQIDKDTPDEDLQMARQRVKDVHERLDNTLFYTLAGKSEMTEKPGLE